MKILFLFFKLTIAVKVNVRWGQCSSVMKSVIRNVIAETNPEKNTNKNNIHIQSKFRTTKVLKKTEMQSELRQGDLNYSAEESKLGEKHTLLLPNNLGFLTITNEVKDFFDVKNYNTTKDQELNVTGEISDEYWKDHLKHSLDLRVQIEDEDEEDLACIKLSFQQEEETINQVQNDKPNLPDNQQINIKNKQLKTIQPIFCSTILQTCNDLEIDVHKCKKTKLYQRLCKDDK